MPIPARNEEKSNFLKRCIRQVISEGKTPDQAVAICNSIWKESLKEEMELEKWDRAYINSLPDSAFVIIEPAYKEGKTKDKNARHLPYKDKNGRVDLDHLRNALARVNQIKAVTGSMITAELRRKAAEKLKKLAEKYLGK